MRLLIPEGGLATGIVQSVYVVMGTNALIPHAYHIDKEVVFNRNFDAPVQIQAFRTERTRNAYREHLKRTNHDLELLVRQKRLVLAPGTKFDLAKGDKSREVYLKGKGGGTAFLKEIADYDQKRKAIIRDVKETLPETTILLEVNHHAKGVPSQSRVAYALAIGLARRAEQGIAVVDDNVLLFPDIITPQNLRRFRAIVTAEQERKPY